MTGPATGSVGLCRIVAVCRLVRLRTTGPTCRGRVSRTACSLQRPAIRSLVPPAVEALSQGAYWVPMCPDRPGRKSCPPRAGASCRLRCHCIRGRSGPALSVRRTRGCWPSSRDGVAQEPSVPGSELEDGAARGGESGVPPPGNCSRGWDSL